MPKVKKPLPIFVRDTREKKGKGWIWRKSSVCGGMEVYKLDNGDYSIKGYEDKIVVERKGAPSELLSNIMSNDKKRFVEELKNLASYKFAYIVCEFSFMDLLTSVYVLPPAARWSFTPDKICGALASLIAQYKIPILFLHSSKKTSNGVNYSKLLAQKLLLKAYKYIEESDE